jgi:hypothetical protein
VIALGADLYPQTFASGVEHMADLVLLCSSKCWTPTPAVTCKPRSRSGGPTKRSMRCAHRCSASC